MQALDALTSGAASKLLATRRITPLFTTDHKGSRQQDGSQKKYFGSYLVKLRK